MADIINIMCDAYDKAAIEHRIPPKQYGKNHKSCGVCMESALQALMKYNQQLEIDKIRNGTYAEND